MAWFSLAKIALQAGGKIYANRQKAKVAMSDAQLLHAERQARGEEAYQGKLLEARQTDLQGRICTRNYFGANNCANVGSDVRRSGSYGKGKIIF